jgi:hypothetical protein
MGFQMKLAMIAASLILAGSAQAQTAIERYDLQERCGKRTAEVFERSWGSGLPTTEKDPMARYENHYSFHFNKCFYLETIVFQHQEPLQETRTLWDINENKAYGGYSHDWKPGLQKVRECWVKENRCRNEEEWRALVKPFMED